MYLIRRNSEHAHQERIKQYFDKIKNAEDRAADVLTDGTRDLASPTSKTMSDWFQRRSLVRSRIESWKLEMETTTVQVEGSSSTVRSLDSG